MFIFIDDSATTEIYTLSLHDALPISVGRARLLGWANSMPRSARTDMHRVTSGLISELRDRKSTRLNSSHANISYAVFCLKKKKQHNLEFILILFSDTRTYVYLLFLSV